MSGFPAIFEAASVGIRDALRDDSPARLTPRGGGDVVLINGKFENDFLVVAVVDGVGMESRKPVFEFLTADYPAATQGDMLIAPNGLNYKVIGVEPNKNFTMLILELRP